MYLHFRRLLCFLGLLVAAGLAHAQLSTAGMFGTVTDATGAAIPNAQVVLTQTDTGFTRTVTAKSNGEYRADFLPVGPYKLTISAPGFQKLDRSGITLTVTEQAKLDLELKPGSQGETVEVTGEVPLLNAENSTLGRTVSNVEIDNLPLVDRNVYALLDLTPGVQNNNNAGAGSNGGVINPLGYPEQHVKINGSSDSGVGQVSYYLDGGSNMTGVRNTGNPLPNPDAIREFAVQTNNFSAQFGRNSAGVVTVLTKSGTNSFHGSLFEFFRDKNFNATVHTQTRKLDYNQHRFGGTIGGPVLHDKMFFFASAAGFRYKSDNVFTIQAPSAAMLTGNFEENRPVSMPGVPEQSDATKCTVAAQSSSKFWACNPFIANKALAWCGAAGGPNPGQNICPQSAMDPSILAIIKAGLIPTSAGNGAYTRQDLSPFTQQTNEQLGKVDYQITDKQRLTLSYFHQTGDYVVNPSGNNVLNWTTHDYKFNQHEANILHTWTLSNSTVNQLAINYTRLIGGRIASPAESLATYGSAFQEQDLSGGICTATAIGPGCARPQLGVTSWFTAGNAITGPKTGSNVYAIRDVVNTTKHNHTIYFGGEANRENDAQQVTLNNYGSFSFTSHTNTANRSSAAFTDFMFGTPNSMQQDVPVYANANYYNFGAFLEDDWRALPNLTVNLGIRYDIQTTPTDTLRRTMNFVPGAQSTIAPTNLRGVLLPGDAGVAPGGVATRYDHVSPRVGFAWTPYPDGKTVVHAAAGLFYGSIGGNLFTYPSNGEPFSGRPTFNNVIHVSNPYATDPKDFCGGDATCIAGGVGKSPYPFIYNPSNPQYVVKPAALIPIDPNFRWPVIYQFNAGVQQQFARGFAVTINYVGSFGKKLPIEFDQNYPVFNLTAAGANGASCATTNTTQNCSYANTTATANNRRPFNDISYANINNGAANPQFSTISRIQSSEGSVYHAIQASFQQRLSHGFTVQGFYVFSKSLQSEDLDTAGNTGNSTGTQPEDAHLRYLDRQRSDFDQRHVFTSSVVYKSNYGIHNAIARNVVNGWTLTTIIRLQSGNPFNITAGTDVNQDGVNNDRPNLAPGFGRAQINNNHGSRSAMMASYISPAQFCIYNGKASSVSAAACPQNGAGPAGSDGTLRQNDITGPGRRSVDASIFRDFAIIPDHVRFQIRGESTNVFNLTNLPGPVSTLSAGNFGQITGAIAGGSFGNRVIQVGGRILF